VPGALGVSPDGSKVFVTGGACHVYCYLGTNFATAAYDAATGALVWDTVGVFGRAVALGVAADGSKIVVTGSNATIAYDASTGALLWQREVKSPDGSKVFVTGTTCLPGPYCGPGYDNAYWTVALDTATGRQLWQRYYDPAVANYDDRAVAVALSPDGSKVFVTGQSHSGYGTVAYDAASGRQIWARRFHGPAGGGGASALAVGPDGSTVFVTGWSEGTTSGKDYVTLAYDAATGHHLWTARYNRSANDTASAIRVSPDGSEVFVTGEADSSVATVAYIAATGVKLWPARYHGPFAGENYGTDLLVSPDGSKVFVVGESKSDVDTWDTVTLAYSAG
jgi:DNA-binding beta-propeller fold protein YncE